MIKPVRPIGPIIWAFGANAPIASPTNRTAPTPSENPAMLIWPSKYPPAKPGALEVEPLKAALIDHAHCTHSMTDGLGPISSKAFARARMGPIHYVCTL